MIGAIEFGSAGESHFQKKRRGVGLHEVEGGTVVYGDGAEGSSVKRADSNGEDVVDANGESNKTVREVVQKGGEGCGRRWLAWVGGGG